MARPLLEHHRVPLKVGPPRGLVALACHQDATRLCNGFSSSWKGMTECLSMQEDDLMPRCHHLLLASGIKFKYWNQDHKQEEVQEEDPRDESVEDQEDAPRLGDEAPNEDEAPEEHALERQMPTTSMKDSLSELHDTLIRDIATARAAMHRDEQEPEPAPEPEPEPEKQEQEPKEEEASEMNEGTPAYLMGDVEEPAGEKDMGGWTMRAYTPEQQARLNVDEEGTALAKGEDVPSATLEEEKKPEPVKTQRAFHSQLAAMLKQAKKDVVNMPQWLMVMLSLFCLLMSAVAGMYGRSRRKQAALSGAYATLTSDTRLEPLKESSENQV